jgi:hypothetical protein
MTRTTAPRQGARSEIVRYEARYDGRRWSFGALAGGGMIRLGWTDTGDMAARVVALLNLFETCPTEELEHLAEALDGDEVARRFGIGEPTSHAALNDEPAAGHNDVHQG